MSSVKEYANQFFDEYVDEYIKNDVVNKFIKRHERRDLFINNISRELLKAEYKIIRMDILLLKSVVKDFTRVFCDAALEKKKQELWSLSESLNHQRKYSEQLELQKEVENEIANVEDFNP